MKTTTVVLMIIAILSKILGFVRELSISYYYGASSISDAYFIALTIPVVIFSVIGNSITAGYIPLYNNIVKEKDEKESKRFTSVLITAIIIFCTIIILIIQSFTMPIISILAFGFKGETLILAASFSKITILAIYFTGIVVILNGFLQIKNKFIMPAILGIIFNIIVILSVYLSEKINVVILAWGIIVAAVVQFLLVSYIAKKENYSFRFILDFKNSYLKKFAYITIPLMIGISLSHINILIDKAFASKVAEGAVSALNYAELINLFVLSSVVMPIATVIYPTMSKMIIEDNKIMLGKLVKKSIVIIAVIIVPSTAGILCFSKEIIKLLFERGAFDAQATYLTATAVFFYAMGMLAMGVREVVARVFYSMQNSKTPALNALLGIGLNIGFNIILTPYFGIAGLALATALAANITTIMLVYNLKKQEIEIDYYVISKVVFKTIVMSTIMSIIIKICYVKYFCSFSNNISLLLAVSTGFIVYTLLLYSAKIEEIDKIASDIISKLRK